MCPDHTHKEDHKVIPVNNKTQESCMDTWVDSQVLEFGSLLRGCRVEVPRPGTYSLMTDWTVVILYLSHLYTEVSMRLLLNDLTCVQRTYELGLELGVPESDHDDIEVDYRFSVADRRRETLRKWERIDERPSWSKLVRALVAINERRVARNIAEKYGILHSLKYWGPDCTLGSLGLVLGLSCKSHMTGILGGSAPLPMPMYTLTITIYGLYCISVGVPFPSELEPETAQKSPTAFPAVKTEVNVKHRGLLLVRCVSLTIHVQLDSEPRTRSTEKDDSKVTELDKELDKLEMERRQNRERTASAREEAEVMVEDVERLEREKQLLLEEIKKKESELDCFNKLHAQHLSISQREKEVLQEIIKVKENELRDAKDKLQEKEKKLEKCKEKIQNLKKRIEEGVRELGVRDGRITELEQDKARAVAELELERMKVRIRFSMADKSGKL